MQAHEVTEPGESWEAVLDLTLQPEATLQAPEWAALKAETGWQPRRFIVGNPDRPTLVCQILLRQAGPIRIGYAHRGPIWRSRPDRESLVALVTELKKLEPKPAFIRLDPAVFDEEVVEWLRELGFRRSFEQFQPELTMVVDLHGEEGDLLSRMPQKGRYNIKVALKKGVVVRVGDPRTDREALKNLFGETAARDGIAVHPVNYYVRLLELLGERGELLIAEHDGRVLAATIVEYRGRWATYLHGASANQGREYMPNYLLQWEMIRRAKARGCSYYDLRGVGPSGQPKHPYYGLRIFKGKFGGIERKYIGAYDLVLDPARYLLYRLGQAGRRLLLRARA